LLEERIDTISMEDAMKLIESCVQPVAEKLQQQLSQNALFLKERQLLRELVSSWAEGRMKESVLPWALNAIVNREPLTAESLDWAISVIGKIERSPV